MAAAARGKAAMFFASLSTLLTIAVLGYGVT
jgi:hypothetical protein